MSAVSSDSAAAKRPIEPSIAGPSPPAKLQRPSHPSPSADEVPGDAANGGEVAGVKSEEMAGALNPRAQRYLVAVEYVGTRFSGSQQQPNQRTVVGVLEEAFHKFIGQPVSIFCSSRTDAGVHALSNVCHVDVERISKRKPGEVLPPHEAGVVKRAVNHFLQKNECDIMVTDVRCVAPDFHARYKALERTYHYRLLSGSEPLSVFEKTSAWHVPENLNVQAMKKACSILVGHHDFSSFRAAGCQANSPMRTLDELTVTEYCKRWTRIGKRLRHRCFVVTARARSFLYHQVRLLVGLLKSVGTGDLTTADAERILNSKTVTAAPPMAPACALSFVICCLSEAHVFDHCGR
ncbi:hypothetical protein GUJ93_ZPchr0012g18810 [Zizania palustris]|uniref:tRNA pseudouridine synthase n=1 Tax=Zizania palustris TaxID=103762 RepID=A0A8J5WP22_ZIZPA|nr:hypothetical protein GUJ93_ZPchr0012g18810 [Zizania palustris]